MRHLDAWHALFPEHRSLTGDEGFDEPPPSETALIARARRIPPSVRTVVHFLSTVVGELLVPAAGTSLSL